MIRLGVVTDNGDPDGLRRLRVQSIDRGVSTSDWIPRITGWDGSDVGVVPIGSTVVLSDLDGGTEGQVILGVLQTSTSNPPIKKDEVGSWFGIVAGSLNWLVKGAIEFVADTTVRVATKSETRPTIEIKTDGEILLSNRYGRISLLPTGFMRVVNPLGEWTTTASGSLLTHPTSINITTPNLTYNGVQVAVVGGTDTGGDTTIS
jgi:hypothetical protein